MREESRCEWLEICIFEPAPSCLTAFTHLGITHIVYVFE